MPQNSFASPNPMPSIFLNFLYNFIINQIIPYPRNPPNIDEIRFVKRNSSMSGMKVFKNPDIIKI